MTNSSDTKSRFGEIQSLLTKYEDAIAQTRLNHRNKLKIPLPSTVEEIRQEQAEVRNIAIDAMSHDEALMGLGVLLAAWQMYRSGGWQLLQGEYDNFLDYMRNGMTRYTVGYREDMYRIINRIFAWVNKPSTCVQLKDGRKITVEMIFEVATVYRLKLLSPLFDTDDEDEKARHLRYIINGHYDNEDDQKESDEEYNRENGQTGIKLPDVEVHVVGKNRQHLYMHDVSDKQLAYIQLVFASAKFRAYEPPKKAKSQKIAATL